MKTLAVARWKEARKRNKHRGGPKEALPLHHCRVGYVCFSEGSCTAGFGLLLPRGLGHQSRLRDMSTFTTATCNNWCHVVVIKTCVCGVNELGKEGENM